MSRVPRFREHLKTAFTAEATSAARCRAYGQLAEREGRPVLAKRWLELATAKDELAVRLLEAGRQVADPSRAVSDALAEERYENDVLYAKMIRDVDERTAEVLRAVVAAQEEHVTLLEALRAELTAASGRDVA